MTAPDDDDDVDISDEPTLIVEVVPGGGGGGVRSSPSPYLEMAAGPRAPQRFELEGDVVVVGRGPGADIRIDSAALSGAHLRLFRSGGDYTCEDVSSGGGVMLNRVKIHSATLRDGDVLELADVIVIYREGN